MDDLLTFCCPCLFGLESVLSFEVKKLGGQNVQVTDGRVTFQGDPSMIAKANIWLRTAERVEIVLGQFRAESFTELFDQTTELPWERFIGREDRFPVKCASLNSKLFSVPDCQKIIKKAVVKRLEKAYHMTWFPETGPLCQIQCLLLKNTATLMLDTSGPSLHKRGYRPNANEAPIKETLAAGIVDFARVRGDSLVLDPMCGSGTLLIEAALKALNIAPGIRRRFAAQNWGWLDERLFQQARQEAVSLVKKDVSFMAYGRDIDPKAVQLTLDNAAKAGVASRVKVHQGPVEEFRLEDFPTGKAIILTNPPYGERLLEVQQAEAIYKTLGQVFPKSEDTSYYIISPHEEFEDLFGRPASKRRKLYNGMIKCQVFMYFNELNTHKKGK